MTEPRFRLTESFLAQCYAAKTGKDQAEAAEACAVFLSISQAMIPMLARALEATEQDAYILHLAGQGVKRATIALRLGVNRATVFRAIREHQQARRAALKQAS